MLFLLRINFPGKPTVKRPKDATLAPLVRVNPWTPPFD